MEQLGAQFRLYTMDGGELGSLEDETFSADCVEDHHPWRKRASRCGERQAGERDKDRGGYPCNALPKDILSPKPPKTARVSSTPCASKGSAEKAEGRFYHPRLYHRGAGSGMSFFLRKIMGKRMSSKHPGAKGEFAR